MTKYITSVLNQICYVQKCILTKMLISRIALCEIVYNIGLFFMFTVQPYIVIGKVVGLTFKMYIWSGKIVI